MENNKLLEARLIPGRGGASWRSESPELYSLSPQRSPTSITDTYASKVTPVYKSLKVMHVGGGCG